MQNSTKKYSYKQNRLKNTEVISLLAVRKHVCLCLYVWVHVCTHTQETTKQGQGHPFLFDIYIEISFPASSAFKKSVIFLVLSPAEKSFEMRLLL